MAMPSFELGAEALNSGPRAYIASFLASKPSLQLKRTEFYKYSGHNTVSRKSTQNNPLDYM